MTLDDFILLALFGAICYGVGRVHAMYTIVKTVMDLAEETPEPKTESADELAALNIQKHHGTYYAYMDEHFVAQSGSLQDLVSDMKNKQNITSFKVTYIEELDSAERVALAEAIHNTYQIK